MTFAVPRILAALQKDTGQFLAAEVPPYLESCDDLLFSLAEKARSQSEQNLYFNSLRSLRLHREHLQALVLERCQRQFERWFETLPIAAVETRHEDSLPKGSLPEGAHEGALDDTVDVPNSQPRLSLVENAHLEQEIAITGVITEAETRSRTALSALSQRLQTLLPTPTDEPPPHSRHSPNQQSYQGADATRPGFCVHPVGTQSNCFGRSRSGTVT